MLMKQWHTTEHAFCQYIIVNESCTDYNPYNRCKQLTDLTGTCFLEKGKSFFNFNKRISSASPSNVDFLFNTGYNESLMPSVLRLHDDVM